MVQNFAGGAGSNGSNSAFTINSEEIDILPIGSIFMSIDDTDPAISLGYGTWLRFAQGRMLIGVDDNDSDFNSAGDIGGFKTAIPAGTVQQAAFTGSALSGHSHTFSGSALGTHTHSFTGDALANHLHTVGTIAPSTHSGAAVAAHANHNHGVGTLDAAAVSAGTPVGAVSSHAHELPVGNPGGTPQFNLTSFGTGASRTRTRNITNATVTAGSTAAELSSAVAPTFTGSALATHDHTLSGSTGNESSSLTHIVTQPSDHTMSGSSANASAGTPSGTNTSVSAGTPAGSNSSNSAGIPSGTINAQSFTGASHSIMNPFFAVFIFRRTA